MTAHSYEYARHGGKPLLGDLYLPEAPGPHPVLLAVPGGAWRGGSRTGLSHWGSYLSQCSFATFVIDHRRSRDGVCFPHAVQDVRAALRWLAGNAETHRLDIARLGILGASAGAHLGSLAALSGNAFDPPEAPATPPVRALALAYGVYDLTAHWQECRAINPPGRDATEAFLGVSPYDDPMLYQHASPIRHVRTSNNSIPVFLTWGTADEAVPPTQSEAFHLALRQAGFFVRTCPVPGAGHFWFSDDPIEDAEGFTAFVAPRLMRFLNQHLNGTPPMLNVQG